MNLQEILAAIEMLTRLITIVGDQNLSEAKTWLEVKANAERLRQEGHEGEEEPPVEEPEGDDGEE